MTLAEIVSGLRPLLDSKAAGTITPVIVSSVLGSTVALVAYKFKSREPLHGSVTWQWHYSQYSGADEEPYLTIQNRSAMPAYLKRARMLQGSLIKTEAVRYAFSYEEPDQGNFPLELKPSSVTSFPLSRQQTDRILKRAWWFNRVIGYVFKRNYVWLELTTIGGARLIVPANDASSFRERPLWIELRWFPAEKPDWYIGWEKALAKKSTTETD